MVLRALPRRTTAASAVVAKPRRWAIPTVSQSAGSLRIVALADRSRADKPRIESAEPQLAADPELTNRHASCPKRAANLTQPRWGGLVTSITAEPTSRRVPTGRLAGLKPDRRTADPRLVAVDEVHRPQARRPVVHYGQLPVRVWRGLSAPHGPGVADQAGAGRQSGSARTSRSSTAGRRTISATMPPSGGESRT